MSEHEQMMRHAALVQSMKAEGQPIDGNDVRHELCSGVYAKQIRIRAGFCVMSHKHTFDHLSILASGHVRVVTEAGETVHTAPALLRIAAGQHHAVHALQDSIWFCLHATDETDLETIDDSLIERPAS